VGLGGLLAVVAGRADDEEADAEAELEPKVVGRNGRLSEGRVLRLELKLVVELVVGLLGLELSLGFGAGLVSLLASSLASQ
jgi:hypothetical protein